MQGQGQGHACMAAVLGRQQRYMATVSRKSCKQSNVCLSLARLVVEVGMRHQGLKGHERVGCGAPTIQSAQWKWEELEGCIGVVPRANAVCQQEQCDSGPNASARGAHVADRRCHERVDKEKPEKKLCFKVSMKGGVVAILTLDREACGKADEGEIGL